MLVELDSFIPGIDDGSASASIEFLVEAAAIFGCQFGQVTAHGGSLWELYRAGISIAFLIQSLDLSMSLDPSLSTQLILLLWAL